LSGIRRGSRRPLEDVEEEGFATGVEAVKLDSGESPGIFWAALTI
jgi:hypothetical protein